MKICVWRTGHEIADRVADSISKGWYNTEDLSDAVINDCDFYAHIGYGILRGMDKVFRACDKINKPWFNIDRGYFKPKHFTGYYRISLRGTQHTQGGDYADYRRLRDLGIDIAPWRGFAPRHPVLVCPPTDYVLNWIPETKNWLRETVNDLVKKNIPYSIRFKDAHNVFDMQNHIKRSNYVVTFNSAVGWEALRLGVPCVSDPNHSIVGSHFRHISLDKLSEAQDSARRELFATMASLQLTLAEIKSGLLWPLMQKLLDTGGINRNTSMKNI